MLNPSMASLQGKAKESRTATTKVDDMANLSLDHFFQGQAYEWGLHEFFAYMGMIYLGVGLVVFYQMYQNQDRHLTAHFLVIRLACMRRTVQRSKLHENVSCRSPTLTSPNLYLFLSVHLPFGSQCSPLTRP